MTPKPKDARLEVRVSQDLLDRLDEYAATSAGDRSSLTRLALELFLDGANGNAEVAARLDDHERRLERLERRVRNLDAWSNLE